MVLFSYSIDGELKLGGTMDFLTNFLDPVVGLNWEVIFNLVFVTLIMLAGPAVVFLLAFRGGDI
jgi:Photosystem II complex subunit Ycf12